MEPREPEFNERDPVEEYQFETQGNKEAIDAVMNGTLDIFQLLFEREDMLQHGIVIATALIHDMTTRTAETPPLPMKWTFADKLNGIFVYEGKTALRFADAAMDLVEQGHYPVGVHDPQ